MKTTLQKVHSTNQRNYFYTSSFKVGSEKIKEFFKQNLLKALFNIPAPTDLLAQSKSK